MNGKMDRWVEGQDDQQSKRGTLKEKEGERESVTEGGRERRERLRKLISFV